jgi:hypothetical protein
LSRNGGVLPKKSQSFLLTFSWCSSRIVVNLLIVVLSIGG